MRTLRIGGERGANLTIDPTHAPEYPKFVKVSAQYAEEHLVDLLRAADNGEEIEITRPGKPTYRLQLVKAALPRRPHREIFGAWEGLVTAPTEEEWRAIKKEFADQMQGFSKLTDDPA